MTNNSTDEMLNYYFQNDAFFNPNTPRAEPRPTGTVFKPDWKDFAIESLKACGVLLFYIFACVNAIALLKIFPYTIIEDLGECGKLTYLDYIYPTNLRLPPYQAIPPQCGSRQSIPYVPSGDCAYEGVDYGAKFHELFYALKQDLGEVQWPYTWLQEDPTAIGWAAYWSKFKIANIILNQCYYSRWIMKFFCGAGFWRWIPDLLLFALIPLGINETTGQTNYAPLAPMLIYCVAVLAFGINILVTIATWLYSWMPTGEDVFRCQPGNTEKDNTSKCMPNFFYQLMMLILQVLSILGLWLFSNKVVENRTTENMFHGVWWREFLLIILMILSFVMFLWAGGSQLFIGAISSTVIGLSTLLTLYYPLFFAPKAILNILYCNKDILALIFTFFITLTAQEQKTLDSKVTNTMWGVWFIFLLIKIFNIIRGFF